MSLLEFDGIASKVTLPLVVLEFTTLGGQSAISEELLAKNKHRMHHIKEMFQQGSPLVQKYGV